MLHFRQQQQQSTAAAAAAAAAITPPLVETAFKPAAALSTVLTAGGLSTAAGSTFFNAPSKQSAAVVPIKATCKEASRAADNDAAMEDVPRGGGGQPPPHWEWRQTAAAKSNTESIQQGGEQLRGYTVNEDYIRTPGNHLVCFNEFCMDVDRNNRRGLIPMVSDLAPYAQDVYQSWRQQEQKLGAELQYCYAADNSADFERYRIYSVVWVYRTTASLDFNPAICHYAVFSLNRAFRKLKECGYKISLPLFFGILSASLRVAVKHDESFDRQYRARFDARTAFSVNGDLDLRVGLDKINEIESRLVGFLGSPLLPPSSIDFLERFVKVGEWPESVAADARSLARYCLDLALFANRAVLERMGVCAPSLVAAAALALAVKVVGATTGRKYEPWPERLALYTGYPMGRLSPFLNGLCHLLRNKPEQATILEKVHPYWGKQTWQ